MTDDDLIAIEQYLGRPLPPRYRSLMLTYPLDPQDLNSRIALNDNRDHVLAWNAELREGEFAEEWGEHRFAIGTSPCGDTYFLDLTGASEAVFFWDHETHEVVSEFVSLDAFVETLKTYEAEAQQRRRSVAATRPWWKFWK